MPSAKTEIIERIFHARWDPAAGQLNNPLVTLRDVSEAIQEQNAGSPRVTLSARNVANFFKDFIRNNAAANANWPSSVFGRGYSARQRTGGNACFEFVQIEPGQQRPFPGIPVPAFKVDMDRHRIGSASLPLASRLLGRSDEPWLIQVLVELRLVETHLALYSPRRIVQVDHLQMSVKLSETEIDALFLAVAAEGTQEHEQFFVTLEAKGRGDDLLDDQILAQVRSLARAREPSPDFVIPMAAKALAPSIIYMVEFEAISRELAPTAESLVVASDRVYEIVPAVPGVGERGATIRRRPD